IRDARGSARGRATRHPQRISKVQYRPQPSTPPHSRTHAARRNVGDLAMRLTAAAIKTLALPKGVTDKIFFDDELPRFGVRVRAGGSRTWIVQYAIGGRERKLPLGRVTALDPAKARSLAKDVLARVRLGGDPPAVKPEAR